MWQLNILFHIFCSYFGATVVVLYLLFVVGLPAPAEAAGSWIDWIPDAACIPGPWNFPCPVGTNLNFQWWKTDTFGIQHFRSTHLPRSPLAKVFLVGLVVLVFGTIPMLQMPDVKPAEGRGLCHGLAISIDRKAVVISSPLPWCCEQ